MFDNDFSKFDPTPGEGPPDGNWIDGGEEPDEDDCPWAKTILAATLIPKPFGIPWDPDKVKKFLRDISLIVQANLISWIHLLMKYKISY